MKLCKLTLVVSVDMYLACRAPQPDDPNPDEAVPPAFTGVRQEAGEPGCRRGDLPDLLLCWPTRLPGKSDQTQLPAAMAAGVTETLMTFENLFDKFQKRLSQLVSVKAATPKLRKQGLE